MPISHVKLPGLTADRVLATVEPILRAHGVEGVELVWRTDRGGWVLELTLERPDSRIPGAGITVDVCSDISRDLSAALDVAEVIGHPYRLEVGSPGVERALYVLGDYARFAGQAARIKLREAHEGQRVLRGRLQGLDGAERVVVETERGELSFAFDEIETGQLIFEWNTGGTERGGSRPGSKAGKKGAGAKGSGPKGSKAAGTAKNESATQGSQRNR
jgi:ribosome maturation factor RimP